MDRPREERGQRAARNELLFRTVNEQIVELTQRFRAQLSDLDLVCECTDSSCVGTIRLGLEEFARIKHATDTFLVLPGHEDPRVEDVTEHNGHYFAVRKRHRIMRAIG